MGPRPSPAHSVEREDNNGPYSKDNCRWATSTEQANNKRRTIFVDGKTISEIAALTGLNDKTIRARYYRGMSANEIQSTARLVGGDKNGLNRGGGNANAKLTDEDVRLIRQRRANGDQLKVIARDYQVSPSLAWAICARKRWGWLD